MLTVYNSKDMCCGCTACETVCSKNAITMQKIGGGGYKYPVIDQNICVDCGLCRKTCRWVNPKGSTSEIKRFFALKVKDVDVLNKSQSGGAFTVFSDAILKNNGVVYGAYLDKENDFTVYHKRADNFEERNLLRGSKYVQSDIRQTFRQVAEDLNSGKKVLFSGTPCQSDGLLSYIETKRIPSENLYTMDLICHGVPSPDVFNDYLKYTEKKYGDKITGFNFREKKINKWGTHIEEIKFQNRKNVYCDWYANLFYNDANLRPNCYNCQYIPTDRNTDITIGDFWGVENVLPDFYNPHGVSAVMVRSKKALKLLESQKENIELVEVKEKDIVSPQPRLNSCNKKPADYDIFWNDYKNLDFENFMHKHSFNQYSFSNCLKRKVIFIVKLPFRVLRKIYRIIRNIS